MRQIILIIFALYGVISSYANNTTIIFAKDFPYQKLSDTSKTELNEFKDFSHRFFNSIKSNDTSFLKKHVIFPIVNSSLNDPDSAGKEKRINQKFFLKNLRKLFPSTLINKIGKEANYSISEPPNKYFTVTLIDNINGTEVNYDWIFIKKKGKFYFINFTAEPG